MFKFRCTAEPLKAMRETQSPSPNRIGVGASYKELRLPRGGMAGRAAISQVSSGKRPYSSPKPAEAKDK